MADKKNVITIDPSMQYSRLLHFKEKHAAWEVFKAIYWGIYIFILGVLLVTAVPATVSITRFIGWAFVIFALFVIVYGFSSALHLRLLKKYA